MVVQGFRSELVRPRGALLITLQWSHRHKQDFLRRSQGEEASFSHWPAIWAAPLLLLCCKQAVRRSQGTPLPIVPSPLTSLSSLGIAGIYEYTGWRSKLVLRSLLHGSSLEGPRLLPAPTPPPPIPAIAAQRCGFLTTHARLNWMKEETERLRAPWWAWTEHTLSHLMPTTPASSHVSKSTLQLLWPA